MKRFNRVIVLKLSTSITDHAFILTNHPGCDKSPTWAKYSYQLQSGRKLPFAVLSDLFYAWRLCWRQRDFKVVVLGGGARIDTLFLILQRIWPFTKRPVIKIDCLWYESKPFHQFIKKTLFKFLDDSVALYLVWARREINAYSEVFGLSRKKFRFVEYHTTLVPSDHKIVDGEYIFSGGNFARDYATLVKAVEGLDIPVIIACSNKKALEGIDFPENVKVVAVPHDEFMRLMAESNINVVVLQKGLLHSGGQQTFLNAMALGKPVIVTDPDGARDYIENEMDGLLVQPGEPEVLKRAILRLINDREFAARISSNAQAKASKLDTEAHLSAIVNISSKLSEVIPCETEPTIRGGLSQDD